MGVRRYSNVDGGGAGDWVNSGAWGWTEAAEVYQDPELTFLPLSTSRLSKQACSEPRGQLLSPRQHHWQIFSKQRQGAMPLEARRSGKLQSLWAPERH